MKLKLITDIDGIGKKDIIIDYDEYTDDYKAYLSIYHRLILDGKMIKISKGIQVIKQDKPIENTIKQELEKLGIRKLQELGKKYKVNDNDKKEIIAELIKAGITIDKLK